MHNWNGCYCSVCGKIRNTGHIWKDCYCTACWNLSYRGHNWVRDKCADCGFTRKDESDELLAYAMGLKRDGYKQRIQPTVRKQFVIRCRHNQTVNYLSENGDQYANPTDAILLDEDLARDTVAFIQIETTNRDLKWDIITYERAIKDFKSRQR